MRCLVTGASGQLGAALTRRLIAAGAEVFAMVRPESNLARLEEVLDHVSIIYGDLSNIHQAAEPIAKVRAETVFHLAWSGVTRTFRNDPEQITRNVVGSLELFRLVQMAGCRCWVGVGSQAENGRPSVPLTEDAPADPKTAYGMAKLCTGLLSRKLCEMTGVRFVWMRLLATYGPADDDEHLIPSVTRQLLAGKSPSLTPGEQRWDYLYVNDAADALWAVARTPAAEGVFVLGSGEAPSVRSITEGIRDLINPSLPIRFGEMPYAPDQLMHLQADISKLHSTTGWTPKTSLEDGLRSTVEWYRRAEKEKPS
jgi:nucleoside-diphosphate-sugar epimerase